MPSSAPFQSAASSRGASRPGDPAGLTYGLPASGGRSDALADPFEDPYREPPRAMPADAGSADLPALLGAEPIAPSFGPDQWRMLDAYAPEAVDALLAAAARRSDAAVLESAMAAGLLSEADDSASADDVMPRRVLAIWRLLASVPDGAAIAGSWLGRALTDVPGAIVQLLLDVSAPDWTTLAAAVVAAGVDPWMRLPGRHTRIEWGTVGGASLESPAIVALALARGPALLDRPHGPSALRVLAPRPRAGMPVVGLLHDLSRPGGHGRPVDWFEAVVTRYERQPMPESEIAFAFGLADPSAPVEPDDAPPEPPAPVEPVMQPRPVTTGPTVRPANMPPPSRTVPVPPPQPSPPIVPGPEAVAARIRARAGQLLAACLSDPASLAGIADVPPNERPETVDALRRPRWLLATRLAALAGTAARPDPVLDQHDRVRFVPWPLAISLAVGGPQRSARAEAQADDRRAAATLRAIAGSGVALDATDPLGRNALLLACRRPDRPETVRTLLELGANPNHVDGRGRDASAYARQGGSIQVISMVRNAQARTVLERLRGPDID